jgi:TIR domain
MSKVFISHRGADSDLAEKLAQSIKSCGRYEVWFDAWDVKIGDSIVGKINDGLTGNIALILCLSSSGSSPWMDTEWMSLLARQLQGQNVKLLPVRLSGGTIPPILAHIKFADLVSDWDGGIKNLLQVLA